MYIEGATVATPSAAESCDLQLCLPGRYQLLSESGRGGMGIVLKAFDTEMKRVVAVKMMRTDHHLTAETAEYVKRFRREWEVTAGLSHPNIVTLFDSSVFRGVPFFVMEHLEGRPLGDVMKERGALPIEEICKIFAQLCDAVGYAHDRGIIHRDLKPSNLMLLSNGILKVTDFGVARTASSDLTQIGTVVGTPRYKSPEELNGFMADHRSDIFSLGIILHELLTGQHPFDAPTGSSVVRRILCSEPTWPSDLNHTLSPKIRLVVTKALAKFPENRYQSCRELISELRDATATLRRPIETTNPVDVSIRRCAYAFTAVAAKAQRLHQDIHFPKSAKLRVAILVSTLFVVGLSSSVILVPEPKVLPKGTDSNQPSTYRVIGAVRFPTGPAQGLTLDLRNLITGEARKTNTNQQGYFQFDVASAGPYELSLSQQPWMAAQVSAPATFLAGNVERRDFLLTSAVLPASLKVLVRSDDGKPVQGFEVLVFNQDNQSTLLTSGKDGSYEFSALNPGIYEISVKAPFGYRPARGHLVSLAAGESRTLDFLLRAVQTPTATGEVCGTINADSSSGFPSAKLQLFDEASRVVQTIRIDRLGPFCFEQIPAGTYSIRATASGGWSVQQLSGLQVRGGGIAQVKLLFHQNTDGRPLPLELVLRGTVKTVGGLAMPFVHVRISGSPSPDLVASVVTDSTGQFTFELQPGEYRLSVNATSLFAASSATCAPKPQSLPSQCILILNPALAFRAVYHRFLGTSGGYLLVTESHIVYTSSRSNRRLHFVTAKIHDPHVLGKSDLEFSYGDKRYRFTVIVDPANDSRQGSLSLNPETLERAVTDFPSVIATELNSKLKN